MTRSDAWTRWSEWAGSDDPELIERAFTNIRYKTKEILSKYSGVDFPKQAQNLGTQHEYSAALHIRLITALKVLNAITRKGKDGKPLPLPPSAKRLEAFEALRWLYTTQWKDIPSAPFETQRPILIEEIMDFPEWARLHRACADDPIWAFDRARERAKEQFAQRGHPVLRGDMFGALKAFALASNMSAAEFVYYHRACQDRNDTEKEFTQEDAIKLVETFFLLYRRLGGEPERPQFCTEPIGYACPWCHAKTKAQRSLPTSAQKVLDKCGACQQEVSVEYRVGYKGAEAQPYLIDATKHGRPAPPPPLPEFCTAELSVSCAWCSYSHAYSRLPTSETRIVSACKKCSGETAVEYSVKTSGDQVIPRLVVASKYAPPPKLAEQIENSKKSLAPGGNSPKPNSLPDPVSAFSDNDVERYRIRSKGFSDYLKSFLGFLVEFLGIIFGALPRSWIGFFILLTLTLGIVSSARRCLTESDVSKKAASKVSPKVDSATSALTYLEADTELVIKRGEYASDALRVRMDKICKHPEDDSKYDWRSIHEKQIAIDLIEVACVLGYAPGGIPSPTRVRVPRTFYCPTNNEQPTLSSVQEKFCPKAKGTPHKTRATKGK